MSAILTGFVGRQRAEIDGDRILRIYGVVLGCIELICVLWLTSVHADKVLGPGGEVLCWPMLPNCGDYRILGIDQVRALLVTLGLLSLSSAIAFWRRWRGAWVLLFVTEILKLVVMAQDFRFRQNQFYMFFFVWFAFLFLPNKRRTIRYLAVLFYFWAGFLKLNTEWLSGAALYGPKWFIQYGTLVRICCTYVVVLELVIVWGLLAERAKFFWIAFAQIFLFEAFSWFTVNFFYPLLMLGIISIFPLCRLERAPAREAPLRLRGEPISTWVYLILFCLLQMIPRAFPGDSAVTGEGRLFALHMFDARVECKSTATLLKNGRVAHVYDLRPGLPIRTACDPIVVLSRGKTLCARFSAAPYQVDIQLESKRSSDSIMLPLIDIKDFCRNVPQYRWWRHNDWIRSK